VAPTRASLRERVDKLLEQRAGSGDQPSRSAPRGRRGIVALALLGLLALVLAWFLVSLFQPGKGEGKGVVAITIPRGAGVGDIGDLLEKRGVVSSDFFFELRTTLAGHRGDLKPGIYNLKRDMSYGAALDALTKGPSPNLLNVTFPEGFARREIGPRVKSAGVKGDYVRASQRARLLNPRRYGAVRARDLEGFLFPATYQMRRGQTARTLVDKQLIAFKREWAGVDLRAARRKNLTAYDVLIIASLVEREAQLDKERAIVASVIYNRLKAGMNLGIDATVRYALNNWTRPLKRSELASSSSYNTYNHPGLPPGPIGNPGLAAMKAAASPARTRYLYYVVKPGTCGEHVFAATAAEHDRNVARYNRARDANGGRSPTKC
jgi:peptidoglycan lytic transglycosylase G